MAKIIGGLSRQLCIRDSLSHRDEGLKNENIFRAFLIPLRKAADISIPIENKVLRTLLMPFT